MSERFASNVAGLPTGPISWLPFRVRKLVSIAGHPMNEIGFELSAVVLTVVVAVTVSVPGWRALYVKLAAPPALASTSLTWGLAPVTVNRIGVPAGLVTLLSCAVKVTGEPAGGLVTPGPRERQPRSGRSGGDEAHEGGPILTMVPGIDP